MLVYLKKFVDINVFNMLRWIAFVFAGSGSVLERGEGVGLWTKTWNCLSLSDSLAENKFAWSRVKKLTLAVII